MVGGHHGLRPVGFDFARGHQGRVALADGAMHAGRIGNGLRGRIAVLRSRPQAGKALPRQPPSIPPPPICGGAKWLIIQPEYSLPWSAARRPKPCDHNQFTLPVNASEGL